VAERRHATTHPLPGPGSLTGTTWLGTLRDTHVPDLLLSMPGMNVFGH